jgi:hypothetical protein
MTKSRISRRADLQAAAKRFTKKDTISLEDVARLWGVSKARFVNVRNEIADFPEPLGKEGNAYVYAAKPVVDCLLRHETRNDKLESSKASKVAQILGGTGDEHHHDVLPPTEMLAMSRVRAEAERRMREQGLLVQFDEVQQTMATLFGYMSNVIGKLSDSVDPNGKLPGDVRARLDGLGKELLLRMYDDLNDMLADDANDATGRTLQSGEGPDSARAAKVRPKGKGSSKARASRTAPARRGKHKAVGVRKPKA